MEKKFKKEDFDPKSFETLKKLLEGTIKVEDLDYDEKIICMKLCEARTKQYNKKIKEKNEKIETIKQILSDIFLGTEQKNIF